MTVLVALMGTSDKTKKLQQAAALASYFATMKFSRTDEFEADKIAVQYSAKAGFNPNGIGVFLNRINKDNGLTKVTKYFSTHPPSLERIQRVSDEVKKVTGKAPTPIPSSNSNAPVSNTQPQVSTTPTRPPTTTTSRTTIPSGITLEEAYKDYVYTKSIYEQKVSNSAPYAEVMSAFNDYQRAKEIYFRLREAQSGR